MPSRDRRCERDGVASEPAAEQEAPQRRAPTVPWARGDAVCSVAHLESSAIRCARVSKPVVHVDARHDSAVAR